ncbi:MULTISPECIES: TraB/GumN family protein [Bacillaceae]|uniref:TraB/GumN family protein n=1 Tax=Evansella alkalicola TaxID=745819 RepID=A0ABS6JNI1_9BACI|nr:MULTISPECIES: TraB/GumN family protein [Bacillaceae]MBU9720116.1 TraB/GumN family protein [Bacillus alkalicola]
MKKGLLTLFSLFMILLMLGCTSTVSQQLEFEDQGLADAVEDASNTEGELTAEVAEEITTLDASDRGITSLGGIEYLTALEELNLDGNSIEDLTILTELENLQSLSVKGNPHVLDKLDTAFLPLIELEENGVLVAYEEEEEAIVFDGDGPRPEGVFYKVEEGSNTVYLLGSIHVGTEDLYPLHESIDAAFYESDYLAVELDITDIDEIAVTQFMMQHGMYTDGSTLQEKIGDDAYNELVTYVQPYGLDAQSLNIFKPWVAMDLLTTILAEEAGFYTELGVDLYFLEHPVHDVEVIPLETMEQQLSTMLVMSDESQAEDLISTIEAFDEGVEELHQLMDIWINGDIDVLKAMRTLEDDASDEYKEYMQAMTDDRDELMAEKIEEFLLTDSDETYFVVVGAMHLVGEKSIIGLLQSAGYDVVPGIQ